MHGTLYGVGVGPGAPDLLTLRAVTVLQRVDVILAAASSNREHSAALAIAQPHLRPDISVTRLNFPMTRDTQSRQEAWRKAAEITREVLERGLNAAFLTIGDPLVYSTFGYLMRTLAQCAPHLKVEVVPGVTSVQAAAARSHMVLCEDDERLLLLPGICQEESLRAALEQADTAVILKAYRNLPAIEAALRASGRQRECLFASLVERPGEMLRRGLPPTPPPPPYMSLVLSRRPDHTNKSLDNTELSG